MTMSPPRTTPDKLTPPETYPPLVARDGRRFATRRLRSSDAGALKDFHISLSPQSQRFFLPHAYDDKTLARLLERSEHGSDLILGLFDQDRIAGYYFLWYFKERVPLLGIGLRDDLHGLGLGRQMLELLIREAVQNGNEGIELTTMLDNDRAFALYRNVGFSYTGNVENTTGDGTKIVERGMFYEILPGARPFDREHRPPV